MEVCLKIGVPHWVSGLAGKYIFLAGPSIVGDGLKRLET